MLHRLSLILAILLTYFGPGYHSPNNRLLPMSVAVAQENPQLDNQDNNSQPNNFGITLSGGRISLPWWMLLGFLLISIMLLLLIWIVLPEKNPPEQQLSTSGNQPLANNDTSKAQLPPIENTDSALLPVQPFPRENSDVTIGLIEQLQEVDPAKRRRAIWELARTADSRAIKPLVDLMLDCSSYERTLILEALSEVSAKTLRPMNHALVVSLQDENAQVRKNAIRDLTKLYELLNQIRPVIYHALDDHDPEVREVAKWALSQVNPTMSIPMENPPPNPPPLDSQFKSSDSLNL
ncbi:MAG: HEAT repeat domain-containing protein [Gloeocapsa sp. DLM2.Bin57]|nr:MAG: HEAT repeat domain-containing protein [Gloeocapsa sp. DLM2.Bin57]